MCYVEGFDRVWGKKNRRACVHGIISINCFQDNNEEEQIPQNTPGLFDVTV